MSTSVAGGGGGGGGRGRWQLSLPLMLFRRFVGTCLQADKHARKKILLSFYDLDILISRLYIPLYTIKVMRKFHVFCIFKGIQIFSLNIYGLMAPVKQSESYFSIVFNDHVFL